MNEFLNSPGLVLTLIGVVYIVFIVALAMVLPRVLTWRVGEPAKRRTPRGGIGQVRTTPAR